MTDITELALITKIKNQLKNFDTVVFREAEANALVEALEKAQTINAAAEKLVRCKGRYHSELNYRALAALFGVNTPDLPPLDSESRTVTVKLPQAVSAGGQGYQEQVERILTDAGIKWEAE